MSNDVEMSIRQNIPWQKLPSNIKQSLGNSQKEYEKYILNFSVKNQLRYKGNLVRQVRKDERRYYEEMVTYSRTSLLLYPYHLSDVMVEGLRITPFQYYTSVLETIMEQERSYDSLPNFTAADCLRLLGIGRNEYIDLMNQCRSGRKLFRRKNVRDLLPAKPIDINIEPWWLVAAGCIMDDDMKIVSEQEKQLIDRIIDHGKQRAGDLNKHLVHTLYKKGLIYLEVPIEDSNYIVVPPLEGFVMNRVLGDYFETLLYKIFVSIDEHTSVGELASVLQIDSQLVKNAVSLYCRLGFARKKCSDTDDWHPTWNPSRTKILMTPEGTDPCLLDLSDALADTEERGVSSPPISAGYLDDSDGGPFPRHKRICFLFDSTLTAFLMMGNLSPGLKSHAVTMFEVGKLLDESIDAFLNELEKVSTARDDSEGEARRYFEHALVLRSTILALRRGSCHTGLDLVRCESLDPLEPDTRSRLLAKNYSLLVSMAPLSKEIRPVTSSQPPHLGPASPLVNSLWFKLFLYHITRDGPPSILLTRGTRLRRIPRLLRNCDRVLVTSWGHDPAVIPLSNFLFAINEALLYSPVLAQAYGLDNGAETQLVPFPFKPRDPVLKEMDWRRQEGVSRLCEELDLEHTCGYVTLAQLPPSPTPITTSTLNMEQSQDSSSSIKAWFDKCSEVSEDQISISSELPENGFNSQECADILGQELDNLSLTPRNSPNRLDSEKTRDEDLSSWTIVDCCFGVPLFEAEVNCSVCSVIVDRLSSEESLEKLSLSNEKLCTRLTQFISYFNDLNKTQGASVVEDVQTWPCYNLVFWHGKLHEWDGK